MDSGTGNVNTGNRVNTGDINIGNHVNVDIDGGYDYRGGYYHGGGYYHPIAAGVVIGAVAVTTAAAWAPTTTGCHRAAPSW